MDTLAPPLRALIHIKLKIQTGTSVREAIKDYSKSAIDCNFAKDLGLWLFQKESEQKQVIDFQKTYRKLVVEILDRGLRGDQVLKPLEILEKEMIEASSQDLERQLKKLPFIVLVPLLFLQLPAFLLLLFGPLFIKLVEELQF